MLSNEEKNVSLNGVESLGLNDLSKVSACPHCKSEEFIKYGRYKNIPRFKCKCCDRTFSIRTNTIWYYSKKSTEVWKWFCFLQTEGRSLQFCSDALNISIVTAFYWRHKFLNVLKVLTDTELLSNHVFMIHHFINESYKGSKTAPTEPREKLWMIFSYDSNNNILNMPYSRRIWRRNNFEKLICSKLAPRTFISSFGNNYIKVFAKNNNKRLKIPVDDLSVDKVREILYSYKALIYRTHGIATKYLSNYLGLVKVGCISKSFDLSWIFKRIYDDVLHEHYIKSSKIKRLTSLEF